MTAPKRQRTHVLQVGPLPPGQWVCLAQICHKRIWAVRDSVCQAPSSRHTGRHTYWLGRLHTPASVWRRTADNVTLSLLTYSRPSPPHLRSCSRVPPRQEAELEKRKNDDKVGGRAGGWGGVGWGRWVSGWGWEGSFCDRLWGSASRYLSAAVAPPDLHHLTSTPAYHPPRAGGGGVGAVRPV